MILMYMLKHFSDFKKVYLNTFLVNSIYLFIYFLMHILAFEKVWSSKFLENDINSKGLFLD